MVTWNSHLDYHAILDKVQAYHHRCCKSPVTGNWKPATISTRVTYLKVNKFYANPK